MTTEQRAAAMQRLAELDIEISQYEDEFFCAELANDYIGKAWAMGLLIALRRKRTALLETFAGNRQEL